MTRFPARLLYVCLIALTLASAAPRAVSSGIVISQVYGGGGNSGATLTHDYIELFNRGISTVDVTGWSVQYASSAGTTWQVTTLSGTIQPGQYYLVRQAQGAGGTVPLPAPDAAGTIAMSATAGKVALVGSSSALSGSCPAGIVDFVGFGGANCFEGGSPTPALSNTTAAVRAGGGCTETDQNGSDFTVTAPTPRNSSAPLNTCDGPPPPASLSIADLSVNEGNAGPVSATFTVSLSAPAPAGGATFDIATADGTATVADGDYAANSLTAQSIPEGQTTYTFVVAVSGDTAVEPNETFLVNVTNVAGVLLSDGQAVGTIVNDDAFVPELKNVVISQVYGGGGNSGATYTHDFIELHNRESVAVNLAGWSVQYASSAGSTWAQTALTGTIGPGGYFLVRQASSGSTGAALPQFDAAGGTNMSGTAGKVALVVGTSALSGTCPTGLAIADFVGYGGANCFEGSAAAPTLSNTTAAIRAGDGSIDTNNNAADFAAGTPVPRNTSGIAPSGTGAATPGAVNSGDTTLLTVTVTPGRVPDSTGLTVTGDLSSIGGPTAQTFFDDGSSGDAVAGDLVFSYGTTVTAGTGSHFIVATIRDAQDRSATTTFPVTVRPPLTAIHAIQGSGLDSPIVSQFVSTAGIVTARKVNGFFLQTADAGNDADPQTSQGLFVFTSTPPAAMSGDSVIVSGTVVEFFGLTQIQSTEVEISSSGNALPSPVELTADILKPGGSLTQLERFEGMRLHAAALVAVAPTNSFGETFTVLSGVPRSMREPGIEITSEVPPDPVTGVVEPGIPRFDLNPERLMLDIDGVLGASIVYATSNVTFSDVTGPLDYSFGNYKLLPETAPQMSPHMNAVAVPAAAANEFTVAGYNIENFSNDTTQRLKASLAIRTVMRSPDVIGVIEIADVASLQALAGQVNQDAVAAGDPDPDYVAYLTPASPTATQNVGFLVRQSRVSVESVAPQRAEATFINPITGLPETLFDRPPLVLHATVHGGSRPGPIIVVVNHLRSFIDVELIGGEGPRVRAKRTAQAESLAELLQELQTQNATTPIIAVGDYNAFQFSDGYTDPISVIKGNPTPGSQIVVGQSADLVDPDFVNLTDTLPADQRYSFVFEGTAQALDHVLVNSTGLSVFQRYAVARMNADFPDVAAAGFLGDPARPEKNSDHDAPVAYFAFPGTPVVTLNGGATLIVEAFTSFTDPGATAHDDRGSLPVSVDGTVNVNVPGDYVITYTATNGFDTTSIMRTVRVVDSIAPVITGFAATPSSLGQPNHQMVDVATAFGVSDASGLATCTIAVSSNEATNAAGDGNTSFDWVIVSTSHVQLRAERSGRGTGRIYTLTLRCSDNAGNQSVAATTVTVHK
jgi:predicted extracellular nuclease